MPYQYHGFDAKMIAKTSFDIKCNGKERIDHGHLLKSVLNPLEFMLAVGRPQHRDDIEAYR
jgi:hypothetical protein